MSAVPDEIAYYYPEPFWLAKESSWVKSLLLFFDQIAILLPRYMYGRHFLLDPTLAEPLEDRGLLRTLEPGWFVDETMTIQLAEIVSTLIDYGAFDELDIEHLWRSYATRYVSEISMSRMGLAQLREATEGGRAASAVYEKLLERGLAKQTRDGVSIPVHDSVRTVYLLTLAQLAHDAGRRRGLDLHPVTSNPGATEAFSAFLNLKSMPSRGQVVAFDMETVSVDLEGISLDEVIAFRDENKADHRRYMQDLRKFAFELSLMEPPDRVRALQDRAAELKEQAHDLSQSAISAWKRPKGVATFGLGLAGAAWSAATGNPIPAILGGLGAGTNLLPSGASGGAYSYLLKADRDLR